jgi:transcriptional regulator with PAS, ATPase and Fis domain
MFVRLVGGWSNPRQAVKRLVVAWEQGQLVAGDDADECADPSFEVAVEPVRREGTRLTGSQVDQIRTLYAQGVTKPELARRFGVHRTTIWHKING